MDYYPSNILLPSASRTTSQPGTPISNNPPAAAPARGIKVTVNTTVIGTGSITVSIYGIDAAGAKYLILASAAIVTNTTTVLTVYPGLPATANVSANDVLPRNYQIDVVANNANAATYSVAADLLPMAECRAMEQRLRSAGWTDDDFAAAGWPVEERR
jgi:hypothetical protein